MNNNERQEWIRNDEGLYNWWKDSRLSITAFIKENREIIDKAINSVLNKEPTK